ncbi:MAG: hypothetical protein FJ167_06990, partial [Gammaproteobacteria bacterium]|nr:hypothetical protein [Gammaproteobacteria bacterium]
MRPFRRVAAYGAVRRSRHASGIHGTGTDRRWRIARCTTTRQHGPASFQSWRQHRLPRPHRRDDQRGTGALRRRTAGVTPEAQGWRDRFGTHLGTERRLSAHTGSNYLREIDALIAWCDTNGIERWEGLDTQHLRLF